MIGDQKARVADARDRGRSLVRELARVGDELARGEAGQSGSSETRFAKSGNLLYFDLEARKVTEAVPATPITAPAPAA